MPYLDKIFIYPIKSLDRVEVSEIEVLPSGALVGDRSYAMIDNSGQFVNAKRYPKIHLLRSQFDLKHKTVEIKIQGQDQNFYFDLSSDAGTKDLEEWMSGFFEFKVNLIKNLEMGFPDDTESPAPTITSTATLEMVQSWYGDLSLNEVRARFRANLELADVEPFWEDQLFARKGDNSKFQIGNVEFLGINPCARCVVPTRNPETGEVYPNFQKTFSKKRQELLPAWAERSQFNHFYRLTVNTRLSNLGDGILRKGDHITIL
ncbi:putative Fe-S protein [Synechococcus sp. PCC 7502]|uniref:MOSC domain-containing protein n=1 Tax=Synechococcus sp. PCC 7502 TaxID=1173263 RepID=UPI00029FD709|nr:MOSC N-terminal beta barrel domain-containing protein [Synechococcus sp. PCC 7502]AFY74100.1 putative Fe-S protein [Synechococcus sp. PCC 7502]